MSIEAKVIKHLQNMEGDLNRLLGGTRSPLEGLVVTEPQKVILTEAQAVLMALLGDNKPPRMNRAATLASKAETRAEKDAAKKLASEAKAAEREALKAAKAEMKLAENTAKMEAKLAADALKEEAKEAAKAAALEAKKAAREAADKVRKEMLAKFEANRAAVLGTNLPGIDPATATTPIRRTKTGIEPAKAAAQGSKLQHA
jgi:hypothetical protein